MSHNIIKNSILLKLPEINGKSWDEVIDYFIEAIGEPDEIEKVGDNIDYAHWEGPYNIIKEGKKWGVERILKEDKDYDFEILTISLKHLDILSDDLIVRFKAKKSNCKVVFLNWYNGADQPKVLE